MLVSFLFFSFTLIEPHVLDVYLNECLWESAVLFYFFPVVNSLIKTASFDTCYRYLLYDSQVKLTAASEENDCWLFYSSPRSCRTTSTIPSPLVFSRASLLLLSYTSCSIPSAVCDARCIYLRILFVGIRSPPCVLLCAHVFSRIRVKRHDQSQRSTFPSTWKLYRNIDERSFSRIVSINNGS